MKVLHLAAGNRWTGAAAPAFAEVEALRGAGIDAHYAYVGGYKLEQKIGHLDFVHPAIGKAQSPLAFRRSLRALDALMHVHGFDILHAHLTYDHWLARILARDHNVRLARTFHSRRVLRTDFITRGLIRKTPLLFVINEEFRDAPAFGGRGAVFTPPPLDLRQFSANGADVRAQYGIAKEERLVTVIGKLSKGRGFEEALQTFALLHRTMPATRMMIIGHGEHRPALESFAASLQIAPHVIWAGYHEDDLAEHYRASDLLLFTARGSDEGHRAVLEAMACGVPVAAYPLEGMRALVEQVASAATPEALSFLAASLLARDGATLRAAAIARSHGFDYTHAARRLIAAYLPQ